MDAIFGDIGDDGRYPTFGKVGVVGVVGYTIRAGSSAYRVGEAMSDTNYIDLKATPGKVMQTIETLASNAAHLARLLKEQNYPAP